MNKLIKNKKRLFVFDFDETLVFDQAKIHVIESNGTKKSFTSFEFHNYEPITGEKIDVSDFSKLNNPTPNHKILSLLEKYIEESAILSARQNPDPISEYMNEIGLEVPEIVTVGEQYPKKNASKTNAIRKREWLQKKIATGEYSHVEFWDDSNLNIAEADKLKVLYPHVNIITHQV